MVKPSREANQNPAERGRRRCNACMHNGRADGACRCRRRKTRSGPAETPRAPRRCRPASARPRRRPASPIRRNDPTKGRTMPNARATTHEYAPQSAPTGRVTMPAPAQAAAAVAQWPAPAQRFAQTPPPRAPAARAAHAPARSTMPWSRSGWPAMTNIATNTPSATAHMIAAAERNRAIQRRRRASASPPKRRERRPAASTPRADRACARQ